MFFQCINIRQVSWEVLKTAAFGLGFQHLPRNLANDNARKTMFDPYMNAQADRSWLGASVMKEMLCLDSNLFLYQDIFNVRKNKTKKKKKKKKKEDHRKEPFQGTW